MNRTSLLIAGAIVIFTATVALVSGAMRGARNPTDYLVIGGIATMLCLVLVFATLLLSPANRSEALFKKCRRAPRQTSRTSTDL
jgi:Na+-driven multidrug efflux pump